MEIKIEEKYKDILLKEEFKEGDLRQILKIIKDAKERNIYDYEIGVICEKCISKNPIVSETVYEYLLSLYTKTGHRSPYTEKILKIMSIYFKEDNRVNEFLLNNKIEKEDIDYEFEKYFISYYEKDPHNKMVGKYIDKIIVHKELLSLKLLNIACEVYKGKDIDQRILMKLLHASLELDLNLFKEIFNERKESIIRHYTLNEISLKEELKVLIKCMDFCYGERKKILKCIANFREENRELMKLLEEFIDNLILKDNLNLVGEIILLKLRKKQKHLLLRYSKYIDKEIAKEEVLPELIIEAYRYRDIPDRKNMVQILLSKKHVDSYTVIEMYKIYEVDELKDILIELYVKDIEGDYPLKIIKSAIEKYEYDMDVLVSISAKCPVNVIIQEKLFEKVRLNFSQENKAKMKGILSKIGEYPKAVDVLRKIDTANGGEYIVHRPSLRNQILTIYNVKSIFDDEDKEAFTLKSIHKKKLEELLDRLQLANYKGMYFFERSDEKRLIKSYGIKELLNFFDKLVTLQVELKSKGLYLYYLDINSLIVNSGGIFPINYIGIMSGQSLVMPNQDLRKIKMQYGQNIRIKDLLKDEVEVQRFIKFINSTLGVWINSKRISKESDIHRHIEGICDKFNTEKIKNLQEISLLIKELTVYID